MRYISSKDPYNGNIIGKIRQDDVQELDPKILKLKKGFNIWSKISVPARIKKLRKVIKILMKKKEDISKLITKEIGRPYHEAITSVDMLIDRLNYFLDEYPKYLKEEIVVLDNNTVNKICYDPIGIVAIISPWNYPINIPFWNIFPAMIAGNVVLLKPSEKTPLVGAKIDDIMKEAGFSDKEFSTLIGGPKIGKAIALDPNIKMISFTGSHDVGKEIYKRSYNNIKKLILELGGNDIVLVMDDADIERCTDKLVWGMIKNSGQACNGIRKIFINKKIFDKFVDSIKKKLEKVKIGDPLDIDTQMGPIKEHSEIIKIKGLLHYKKNNILSGGHFEGNTLKPTLIRLSLKEMKNLNEEFFGPVSFISMFSSIHEAVKIINSYDLGLTVSIWGKKKVNKIAHELDFFTVGINNIPGTTELCPWGGRKDSGLGFIFSKEGFLQFTNRKNIRISKLDIQR